MLTIAFIAVVILFIEFGVMILLAQQRFFQKNVLVSEAVVTIVSKLPRLLGFGGIQLLLFSILLIPFINLSGVPALLDVNVPILLTDLYYGTSNVILFVYLFAITTGIFLFIRWIFILHYIVLEGQTVWEAVKSSWRLTKYNRLKVIINLLMLNLLIFLTGILLVRMFSYIPAVADTIFFGDMVKNYLTTFAGYMTIIFSLFLLPLNIIFITRLFYRFKKNRGIVVEDKVTIRSSKKLTAFENRVTGFFTKRRFMLGTLVVVYITGMFFINYSVNENIVYLKWDVQVAAHRGDVQSAPENSMSAILSAVEKGVDAVEFDVMLTKDGELVLHHDTTLQRIAGIPRRVDEMTYEELMEVDIGSCFSEEFIGERMPTLDEVLVEMKDENVNMIIDLKPTDYSRNAEFAEKVVALVEKHEVIDQAYVQAFNYDILQEIRALNEDIRIGQILFLSAGNLSSLDVDFYTIRQTMLSDRFIEQAKAQNREVWVWTVNIERNMREVLKYDIDGIITSYPEMAQRVIGIDFAQEYSE